MFVLVTVACVSSAYFIDQLNWRGQRRKFLGDPKMCVVAEPRPGVRAPGMLWIFRECSWSRISLATHSRLPPARGEDVAMAKRLFPEAVVGSKLHGAQCDAEIETVYEWRAIPLVPKP